MNLFNIIYIYIYIYNISVCYNTCTSPQSFPAYPAEGGYAGRPVFALRHNPQPCGFLQTCPAADTWAGLWVIPALYSKRIDLSILTAENSSPTTAGSRACRGCSKDQPRSLQSTVRLPQPLPGWPSHV